MKSMKIMLALCALAAASSKAQFTGQSLYDHGGLFNARLSSGTYVRNTPGFLMSGYLPFTTANGPNFVIDKVDEDGTFGTGTTFSNIYQLFDGGTNCTTNIMQETNCYGVTAIESALNPTSNIRYAVSAVFEEGVVFATLDFSGNVVNSLFYTLPTAALKEKPMLTLSPNGDYYVCGWYRLGLQEFIYAFKVFANGTAGWSEMYYQATSVTFHPSAIVADSYFGTPELAIVGTVGTTSTDGFFMTVDDATGLPITEIAYGTNTTNEEIHSISLSANFFGSYITGGRTNAAAGGFAWMMHIGSGGGPINWSRRLTPVTNPLAGPVIAVSERYSNTYLDFEYYGLSHSTGPNGGMLVLKLDGAGNSFSQLGNTDNEFLYNDGSGNIADPVAISNLDQATANAIGIHVFGTDQNTPGQFFMTQACYNGASANCNSGTQQDLRVMTANDTVIMATYPYTSTTHQGLQICKQHQLRSMPINYTPNQPCYGVGTPSLPFAGSNSKMAVLSVNEQKASIIAGVSVFPNPVNDVAEINYTNNKTGIVTITLNDIVGRFVGTLSEGLQAEGTQSFRVDFKSLGLSAGTYFIKIQTGNSSTQQKIIYNGN